MMLLPLAGSAPSLGGRVKSGQYDQLVILAGLDRRYPGPDRVVSEQHLNQVRSDGELRGRDARVGRRVLCGSGGDVNSHRTGGGRSDRRGIVLIAALQLGGAAVADDQVLEIEAGHGFGEGDRDREGPVDGSAGGRGDGDRRGRGIGVHAVELGTSAREQSGERVPFSGIDAQPVFELDGDDPLREPGAVSGRHPPSSVPITLLYSVHRRIRDREVVEVARDVPSPTVADAAVVRLRKSDDVLDVRRGGSCHGDLERDARVRRIDLSADLHRWRQCRDDVVFQGAVALAEGIAVVAIARLFLTDPQPAPGLCVRRAALRALRLYSRNVAVRIRGGVTGNAVVVGIARSATLQPLVDDAGTVTVVSVRRQAQPLITVFCFGAGQIAVGIGIPVREFISRLR